MSVKRGIEALKVSSFDERLKEALSECTITDFAQRIGLSKQAISAYTTGSRMPKQITLTAIADALNVNEAWLLGYDVPKEKGVFDTFVKVKDIPDYIYRFSKTEAQLHKLLSQMFSDDEMTLLQEYRELNTDEKQRVLDFLEFQKQQRKKRKEGNEI